MNEFFESRLVMANRAGSLNSFVGLRGWLAQELVGTNTGVPIPKAHALAEAYLMGIIRAEAASLLRYDPDDDAEDDD